MNTVKKTLPLRRGTTRRQLWTATAVLAATLTSGLGASGQTADALRSDLARARVAERQVRSELAQVRAALEVREALVASRRPSVSVAARSDVARLRAELRAASSTLRGGVSSREATAATVARARAWSEVASTSYRSTAPEAWLPQDPADSLYRAARADLNDRRYGNAARLFAEIRAEYPRSGYVGDAYYFEALARSRVGAQAELRTALELLAVQQRSHPGAATASDGRALAVRIESQLARRGDAQAAESLVGAARGSRNSAQVACDEEDLAMRATALSALLQMDPSRARPILQEVLRSRDECLAELRAQAVFILAQNMDEGDADATVDLLLDLAHRNPDPNPEVREAAVFWLSQTGRDEAVDALVEILESGTASPEVAEHAVFALGQSGNPRAFQVLRDYATDASADPELRANAIFWLGQEGGAEAGPFLRSLYDSLDDRELKERVFFAIAESGGEADRAWLVARALDAGEDVEVRKTALFWAGEAGLTPRQALDIYRTATDRELREQAIFVLTQVAQDDEATDVLMEIARSEEDRELRQQAVFWLSQSDDPRVAEFLLEIIRGGGGGGA